MTASRRALVPLIALAVLPMLPVGAQQAGVPGMQTRTLRNGLQVIVVPSTATPFSTIQVTFRAGAFTQTETSLHGLPHLLEHMIAGQEGERAFSSSILERMDQLEIGYNASTSDEHVSFYYYLPGRNTTAALTLMAENMRRTDFTQRQIQDEARAVRGELQRVASEPNMLLLTTNVRQIFTDAGWERKNAGGNLLSVQDASLERLRTMHQRYYVPNNAAIFVTGDVNADSVFATVERAFGPWRGSNTDPTAGLPPMNIPPLAAISREVFTAPVRDVTFMVTWQGPSVDSDRAGTYAADLFSGVVNQPLSSMQRRLVESGHFQSVSMSYGTRRYVGPIQLFARTTPERAAAAASQLGAELRRMTAADYFTDEDLAFAQKQQTVARAFERESNAGLADILGTLWASTDLNYITTYQDSIATRTSAHLRTFVDTYLKGKNYAVTVMLSPEAQSEIGVRLRTSLATWRVQ